MSPKVMNDDKTVTSEQSPEAPFNSLSGKMHSLAKYVSTATKNKKLTMVRVRSRGLFQSVEQMNKIPHMTATNEEEPIISMRDKFFQVNLLEIGGT